MNHACSIGASVAGATGRRAKRGEELTGSKVAVLPGGVLVVVVRVAGEPGGAERHGPAAGAAVGEVPHQRAIGPVATRRCRGSTRSRPRSRCRRRAGCRRPRGGTAVGSRPRSAKAWQGANRCRSPHVCGRHGRHLRERGDERAPSRSSPAGGSVDQGGQDPRDAAGQVPPRHEHLAVHGWRGRAGRGEQRVGDDDRDDRARGRRRRSRPRRSRRPSSRPTPAARSTSDAARLGQVVGPVEERRQSDPPRRRGPRSTRTARSTRHVDPSSGRQQRGDPVAPPRRREPVGEHVPPLVGPVVGGDGDVVGATSTRGRSAQPTHPASWPSSSGRPRTGTRPATRCSTRPVVSATSTLLTGSTQWSSAASTSADGPGRSSGRIAPRPASPSSAVGVRTYEPVADDRDVLVVGHRVGDRPRDVPGVAEVLARRARRGR